MLDFSGNTTVYLACGVTDLRKSYTGLAAIIKLKFHLDPYSRCMFAFCNRRRTLIKILQWDGSGFWILMKPSEVTAEEANKLGFETAMRWTKGQYQFFVCTHTDKGHIHNHIYFNSTAFDCSRKFHNFLGSSFALQRLSDRVCLEHDLSVIQNPKQHSKGRFLHYGQWIGDKPPSAQQRVRLAIIAALEKKPADFAAFLRLMEESGFAVKRGRGGVVSFLAPGQNKYTRLRASTLGAGFDPEDIRAVIAGERRRPRSGRWGLSLTFNSAWPRARARLMNAGRKSTT